MRGHRDGHPLSRRQVMATALATLGLLGCRRLQGRRVETLPVPTPWPLGPFRERYLPVLEPSDDRRRLRSPAALEQEGRVHLLALEMEGGEGGRLVHAISSDGERFERLAAPSIAGGPGGELLDVRLTVFVEETVCVYRAASDPKRLHLARTLDLVELTTFASTPVEWSVNGAGLLLAGSPAAGSTLVVSAEEGLGFAVLNETGWPKRLERWPEIESWQDVRPVASVIGRGGVHLYLTRWLPQPAEEETSSQPSAAEIEHTLASEDRRVASHESGRAAPSSAGRRVLSALLLDPRQPAQVREVYDSIAIRREAPEKAVLEAGGAVRFNGRWLVYAARREGTLTVWQDE